MKELFDPSKSKVLIVDDSPVNIALLSETLKKQGYSIDSALNGTIALEKAENDDFDLILLDIMMPRIDGFEVCFKLKQNEKTQDVPVIFLTAVTNPASIVKGFEVGGVDYITKPFQNAELFKRVQTHIELKKSREQVIEELKQRTKTEKEVIENLQTQEFLTYISNELLNIDNFNETIQQVISEIGKYHKLSRVFLFDNYLNRVFLNNHFEWCNENIESPINHINAYNFQEIEPFQSILEPNGLICTSNIESLSEEIRSIFILEHAKSVLIAPLYLKNKILGFVGFVENCFYREWKKSEINFLKTISNIISNVYERHIVYYNLRENEEKFRNIFDLSNDCIIIIDSNSRILEANQLCTKLLGYSKEEILQLTITDILPKPYNEFAAKRLTDKNFILQNPINEYEVCTKDGMLIPFEVNSRIIKYNNKEVVLSICRDLTERKQMERKIISTIIETEEKERNRFAKDLHDGLGALLSSINIYINMIRSGELSEAEQENMLIYTKGLIDQAISTAKEIANDLRPTILSRFGLVASVKSFCNQINNTRALQIDFDSDSFTVTIDKNTEIILFRIINELINNTLKHAEAKNIRMKLYNSNQTIKFEFFDDGKGFDLSKKLKEKSNGMGLENIRSRIKSINGKVDIKSQAGEGVYVLIEIRL